MTHGARVRPARSRGAPVYFWYSDILHVFIIPVYSSVIFSNLIVRLYPPEVGSDSGESPVGIGNSETGAAGDRARYVTTFEATYGSASTSWHIWCRTVTTYLV